MRGLLTAVLVMACTASFAQKEKSPFEKFGQVTKEHLGKTVYTIDSSANAVVLSHIGETEIVGNSKGWFSLKTVVHKVTHILNENGYDEANVEIPIFKSGADEEVINNFKAVTYNLADGKVTESKLSRSALIKEQVDKERLLWKFTMPSVKKGSIIEYTYQVTSDFISQPDSWFFQSTSAPTLWSEYRFALPSFFDYQISSRGYLPLSINERVIREKLFNVSQVRTAASSGNAQFTATVFYNRWVIKNVPELRTEPFTRSVRNHLSRLDFSLSGQSDPLPIRSLRNSWPEITKGLLESEYFGKNLSTNNSWLKAEVNNITAGETEPLEKARKVFYYIKTNFKSTDEPGVYMTENLRSVFKSRKGSVAELNVLLTAMLRYVDLDANPVILSTAGHGYAAEHLPMLSAMNYVICKLSVGGVTYYLDASQTNMGFGRLAQYCYNGFAAEVNDKATPIYLDADSLREVSHIFIFFNNTENGYEGAIKKTENYFSSWTLRNEVSKSGENAYFDELKKKYVTGLEPMDFKLEKLNDYESPVTINYKLRMSNDGENLMYVNPFFGEQYSKNPFASAERFYPVEFPYSHEEVIVGSIGVPQGYQVDEMPKGALIYLDESRKSYFEYRLQNSGNIISVTSKLKISKTYFMPSEYALLREFFSLVVKKQSEQIVFKKISP